MSTGSRVSRPAPAYPARRPAAFENTVWYAAVLHPWVTFGNILE
jgi:hypothetical protein